MGNSVQERSQDEIARLRKLLDAETGRCLEAQRELDRANHDFEEFVSTAAHNLREGLREVAAFSQLLGETHAGLLDSGAVGFLDRIQGGAARMESVLAGVVDYWSTGEANQPATPTDMEAVLCQALLSTGKWIAERSALVTHDPLPRACGDFELLAKVLHHLIRNAIEYCDTPSPRVHVSSGLVEEEWVFSVQDNGPGVDAALQGRLFRAFKRLHGQEYPGNGLGLAFCKKTIEAQGGRMWMESTPGAGSTFYFTLPPVLNG